MRILVLSPTLPWPLNMGSKIRIYHVARKLARAHSVTLVSLAEKTLTEEQVKQLSSCCNELHVETLHVPRRTAVIRSFLSRYPYRVHKFQNDKLRDAVREMLEQHDYDIIWVNFLNMMSYLPPDGIRNAFVVLDQHNADELWWQRYATTGPWHVRLFSRLNLWKLRSFQRRMLRQVDVVLSVAEEEATFMRTRVPSSCQVWTAPNGVDVEFFHSPKGTEAGSNPSRIMFCGSMDVTMNSDAASRFAKEIFPLIRESIPDVEFWIVGRNPGPQTRRLMDDPGISVTGTVEDVRPYYREANVVVAPFRYGAGTKLKILEAMAMKVPVVSTEVGCQGIDVIPGTHLLLESTSEGFAERVIEVLTNKSLHQMLSAAGRRLVEDKYGWLTISQNIIDRLESAMKIKKDRG